MSDYIEREAAYQFFKDQLEEETGAYSKGRNAGLRVAMSAVMNNDAIPAADVRPVVLCCDCKHFQVNVSPSGYLPQGVPEWECRYWCRATDPTDSCSYGEKREES